MNTNIEIHVNPITSDNVVSIGYDDDGVAGMWSGQMTQTTTTVNFLAWNEYDSSFHDGNEEWWVQSNGMWTNEDGYDTHYKDVLREYGTI